MVSPPAPTTTIPFRAAGESVDVLVYSQEGGPTLAGAIELVSPANKDRPEHREAFVSKCQTYLEQGVGLVIVAIVTTRGANLHQALLRRALDAEPPQWDAALYATAYRPFEDHAQMRLDIWTQTLSLNEPLPIMSLWVRGGPCTPVELQTTYQRTCREQRIDPAA